MVQLQPGDPAPDFKTTATDGETISLSDYKGKSNVILYFYPEDMTSGCTVEACNFRDDKSKFQELHTVILGVSMDPVEMHKQFTEKDHLNFPLLVDTSGTILKAYGVPAEEGRWPHRWTFLIDKNGKIAKVYQKVNVRVHSEELQADIKALPN
ncbi:MAG TPA: peroxiredoxin [Candidatus Kapabacteria bacterium]|nr:peroxiredoxin [Candidatus Kapabacteria bacterium]